MTSFLRIGIVSLFVSLSLFAGLAKACTMLDINSEQAAEIIAKSEFIGLVKVLQVKETGKGIKLRREVTLEPMQAYIGNIGEPIKVNVGRNSCGRSIMPEGTIYEEIVFKNQHGYHVSSKLEFLPESRWRKLRTKAKYSQSMEKLNHECQSRGGVLATHYQGNYVSVSHCHEPTKDAEKNCKDSRECEGLCLAYYSDEYDFINNPVSYRDQDAPPKPRLPGRCSPWKDMDGCYHEVKNGKILDQVCKD